MTLVSVVHFVHTCRHTEGIFPLRSSELPFWGTRHEAGLAWASQFIFLK